MIRRSANESEEVHSIKSPKIDLYSTTEKRRKEEGKKERKVHIEEMILLPNYCTFKIIFSTCL